MNNIKSGDNVLIIWKNSDQNEIGNLVKDIQSVLINGSVVLENSDMITESSRQNGTFDIIISNWISPHSVEHSDNLLALMAKLLKPSGKVILKDNVDLTSMLRLNGFINITKEADIVYVAETPQYIVGSSVTLKLSNKKADVWKIDDTVEQAWTENGDADTIDPDNLLDEDDLKKPDKESLRVCATTGKRKACADCSCGLAEELRGVLKDTPKSSCGSCYLGDAFRCATCPYLGMPAFKPGEKVMLDLKNDI